VASWSRPRCLKLPARYWRRGGGTVRQALTITSYGRAKGLPACHVSVIGTLRRRRLHGVYPSGPRKGDYYPGEPSRHQEALCRLHASSTQASSNSACPGPSLRDRHDRDTYAAELAPMSLACQGEAERHMRRKPSRLSSRHRALTLGHGPDGLTDAQAGLYPVAYASDGFKARV